MQQLSRTCAALMKEVADLKAEMHFCPAPAVATRGVEDTGISRAEMMTIVNTASKVNGATLKTDCLTSSKAEALSAARGLIKSECPVIARVAAEAALSPHSAELAAVRRMVEEQKGLVAALQEAMAALEHIPEAAPKGKAAPKRKKKGDEDAVVIG